ncbi:uncharacterized protein PAC_09866 [Phialocephala subalpina]|uniref:1-alkyl-2-acetylglycerophosphocholine esterase n=1 Tax=Phialocephala subalpina TaxID=576137 RepID=A0A1L7X4L7_9HELO|nr:uncharacterized protein PAC_09866 [Phialocephala subalpina]
MTCRTLFVVALCFCSSLASIQLPKLLGPNPVGTRRIEVIDQGRLDPWAPKPTPRAPILQFWYPIERDKSLEAAPWLPPNAAKWQEDDWEVPHGTLAGIKTRTFADGTAIFPLTENSTTPVLVFSPGSGALCAWYSGFLSSLASFGYTIIGVDHPYDSAPLERPNGELILQANTTDDIAFAAQVRKADVLWLAGQIARESLCRWLSSKTACEKRLGENISLGVFGQSLGGTTANLAMQDSTTLYKSSISIDGPFLKPLNQTGFHGPLFYMAAENSTLHNVLVKEWPIIDGWKLAVKVKGTVHISFSDFPALSPDLPEGDWGDVGSIEAKKINEIMAIYIKEFWDWTLLGKRDGTLLKHESEEFPEVVFQHLDKDTGLGKHLKEDL